MIQLRREDFELRGENVNKDVDMSLTSEAAELFDIIQRVLHCTDIRYAEMENGSIQYFWENVLM